jgi:hypothetical protein
VKGRESRDKNAITKMGSVVILKGSFHLASSRSGQKKHERKNTINPRLECEVFN